MNPTVILIGLVSYFLVLLIIGFITGRKANEDSYFLGNKQSIWWMVALGMLSDSMSGVSFISVPGAVYTEQFAYLQVVMGYVLGYLVIAYLLLPLYYKSNVTSIYEYLEQRFGGVSQKTGAFFFVISRLLGAGGRLFLTALVFQQFLFQPLGLPFQVTVAVIILLILTYTVKGGIKTLVFTDALQSVFLIGGLVICIISMVNSPQLSHIKPFEILSMKSDFTQIFNWDFYSKQYFWKYFLGGMFITIAMTGLDQNMMQKNLSCKSLKDAQKNMLVTAGVVFFVNVLFLSLGLFMIEFLKNSGGILMDPTTGKVSTDLFFPTIALQRLGMFAGLAFVLGLSAATFSSADSVLTTLTTSTYVDIFTIPKKNWSNQLKHKYRVVLHLTYSVLLYLCILGFYKYSDGAVINVVLGLANYTYGPLLGLFALGMFTKVKPKNIAIVIVSLIVPLLCWYFGKNEFVSNMLGIEPLNWKYQFGYELLLLNGLGSFLGYYVWAKLSPRN